MPNFPNDPVIASSTSTGKPAVQGDGVDNEGVRGMSHNAHGAVVGVNDWAGDGTPGSGGNGGWFETSNGEGVRGLAHGIGHGGVVGVCDNHTPQAGPGVYGESDADGVMGVSNTWMGVAGISRSTTGGAGLYGEGTGGGPGLIAKSIGWHGAYGETQSTTGGAGVWGEHKSSGAGVVGKSVSGVGVWGVSDSFEGVHAETNSSATAAMAAYQMNAGSGSAAFFAKHAGNLTAGRFEGNLEVTGNINGGAGTTIACFDVKLSGADCAENFEIAGPAAVDPGSVMVVDEEGTLAPCSESYDRKVAGVISGAGEFKPGLILGAGESSSNKQPIALVGRAYCKVTAGEHPIAVGDLLTTSPVPGHAMKAADPARAFGAVIGKALQPLAEGVGMIAILIALQ